MALDSKSPVVITKAAIILIGVFAMGLGLYSHLQSSWRMIDISGNHWLKPHRLCGAYGGAGVTGLKWNDYSEFQIHWKDGETCPSISMEEYFAFVVTTCFTLSVANLVAMSFVDMTTGRLKFFDMVYHAASAFLALIAGIVYIVSAKLIDRLEFRTEGMKFRTFTGVKITAGSLAIVQGLLYGVASVMIFFSRGMKTRR